MENTEGLNMHHHRSPLKKMLKGELLHQLKTRALEHIPKDEKGRKPGEQVISLALF
jgi:hypothetical protein